MADIGSTLSKYTSASELSNLLESDKFGIVSVKTFGAACDGVTDDTSAVQEAIDYCLSFTNNTVAGQSPIPMLVIPGVCLITSSLMIDRPENQTGFFRIVGFGNGEGFHTDNAIAIFSTNYVGSNKSTPANSVLSNQIRFENIAFSASNTSATAIDLKKYVRTQVQNCFFNEIKLDASAGNDYVQSCYIHDCFARGITGKWLDALDMYDVRVTNCLFEVVSDTVIYAGATVNGGVFSNNLVQNCGNLYVNIATAYGVEVTGCYAEANVGRFVKIDNAYGCRVSGNEIATRTSSPNNGADATFYEVYIGESYGFIGSNNRFSHRGYQIEGTSKIAWVGMGDYAGTEINKYFAGITEINVSTEQILSQKLTVGTNGIGYDVKLYGDTSGKYFLWDESADTMFVVGKTEMYSSAISSFEDIFKVKVHSASSSIFRIYENSNNSLSLELKKSNGDPALAIDAHTLAVTFYGPTDCGASCEANAYTVGGVAGVDYNGVANNITVVKGIVTAVS